MKRLPPSVSEERPFPGLRPFAFEDHEYFFGRQDQVFALYRLADRTRFVAVVGSSGSGKSSLVRAGLLPLIADEKTRAGDARWRWLEMRPGNAPLDALTQALASLADDDASLAESRRNRILFYLRQSTFGVEKALSGIEGLSNKPILIVVDQFEELFRYANFEVGGKASVREDGLTRDDATRFAHLLLEASRSPAHNIHVLLTMRSDFIGECSRFKGLPEAVSASQFLVPSLTRDQLAEVIEAPIEKAGALIEPALVQRLLNDSGASDLDQLPVLQHCLLRLWDKAGEKGAPDEKQAGSATENSAATSRRRLTEEHYAAIGGISDALSRHADEILSDVGSERVVEKVFRSLSELDKQQRAIRRAVPFAQLCAETGESEQDVRRIVDRFRQDDCSFLTPSKSTVPDLTPATQIDVGHEALLRRWKRVSGDAAAVAREQSESIWVRAKELAARAFRMIVPEPESASAKTAAQPSSLSPVGWLQLEERDGERYRSLLSWADNEDGTLPFKMVMPRQRWWTARRPTAAWAERYGGGYDRVKRLIRRSVLKHDLFAAGAALAGVAALGILAALAYSEYSNRQERLAMEQQAVLATQTAEFARRNFKLAVSSAQTLLDQVGEALNHGDIGVKGAKDMLAVASGIVEQVHAIEPTPETTGLLAKLFWTASDIHSVLGDLKQAYDSAKSARDLIEPLSAADPDNPKLLALLYNSYWRMADAMADRDSERATQENALKDYFQAEKLARRLAGMAPADGNWQRNIVFVLQKIGDVRQVLEEWPSAIAVYKAALDRMQKLADGAPDNRLWQRDLANTVSRLGQALAGNRDFDAALEQYQLALKIRTNLWRKDPKDDVLQSNLATSRREIARLYAERGKLDDALAEYRIGIGILEPLALKDPTNVTWQISVAPLYSEAGAVLRRQNNLPAALAQFRNAYRVRRDLALRDPTNPVRQDKSATAGMAIAELLVLQNQDLDEAIKLYRAAIDSLDDWRPRYDRDIFRCYIGIGNIFASQTSPEAALTEYRVALAIARESAAKNPTDVWWRKNLTNAVFQIGEVLRGEGRIAEAIEHYQKVLEFVQGLADEHPKIAEWAALAQSLQAKIDTLKS